MFSMNRFVVLLAASLASPLVFAKVYSPEDLQRGLRAYEAVHGGHRHRDPQLEGRAFEFSAMSRR